MSAYPLTDALRGVLAGATRTLDASERSTLEHMIEVVQEYEHGTADPGDVSDGLTLEQYAAVVEDLILSLANWQGSS